MDVDKYMLFSAVCGKKLQTRLMNLQIFLSISLFLRKGGKVFSFTLEGISMVERKEKL